MSRSARSVTAPSQIKRRELMKRAVDLRVAGCSFEKIADAIGVSTQTARSYVVEALLLFDGETQSSVDLLRGVTVRRYEAIIERTWAFAIPEPVDGVVQPPNIDVLRELLVAMRDHARVSGMLAKAVVNVDLGAIELGARAVAKLAMEEIAAPTPSPTRFMERVGALLESNMKAPVEEPEDVEVEGDAEVDSSREGTPASDVEGA